MKQNTYSKQTAKFISNLIQNMPELDEKALQYWIENAGELKQVVNRTFQPDFFVERTIKVGFYKTPENLISAMKATGASVDEESLMCRLSDGGMNTEEKEVDIIFINTSLVQYSGKYTQHLCSLLEALGCECLTAEMVGALFLSINEKPLDERVEKNGFVVYGAMKTGYRIGYRLSSQKDGKPAEMTCFEAHGRCGGQWAAFVKPRK